LSVAYSFRPFGLQVQDFLNALFREDMVIASNLFLKTQLAQQLAHAGKGMFASDMPRKIRPRSLSPCLMLLFFSDQQRNFAYRFRCL